MFAETYNNNPQSTDSNELRWLKDFLWMVAIAGLVAAILRFGLGLGYTTGLNDATPWGLWIAFKLGFVALAGGGFTLAAIVHIFHLQTFYPILRRAILLALLGYGSFIVSLIFDLGLPWHIYMPIIYWQHHSVMFEIAWCVLLYFTVLVLEFSPVILEHPWMQNPVLKLIAKVLHKATIPLVIAGIVLSTLHQSSLGSLFLIMPHRVHPLWYSPWIPALFFISAIAAGLLGLIVESFLAYRLFNRGLHLDILERLSKIAALAMWLYLALRLGDLVVRGVLPGALDGSWQSILFAFEIFVGGFLPGGLLMIPKIRSSREGLITCAGLGIGGVLSQRMSLSLFTMWRPQGVTYTPSGLEIIIAFAIPAAAGLLYLFFAQNLAVLDKTIPNPKRDPLAMPVFDPETRVLRPQGIYHMLLRRSTLVVLAIAGLLAVLPLDVVHGQPTPTTPVKAATGWVTLIIDGNRNNNAVAFPHSEHQERLAESSACQTCHHLDYPQDQGTACATCHQDYYLSTFIFHHTQHQDALDDNASCDQCHIGEHNQNTAIACSECHNTMVPGAGSTAFNAWAPGYQDAMHETCLECHLEQATAQAKPELGQCATCHNNSTQGLMNNLRRLP